MTRKDFELIARVLRFRRQAVLSEEAFDEVDVLTRMFATELATTNELFNRERFLLAAGVPAEDVS